MTPGQVIIHPIFPHRLPADFVDACLTDEEKSRAARFHFSDDATHWGACRAALRAILGREIGLAPREVPMVFSEYGKPLLASPFNSLHFNLSHCPDLAVVALGRDGPVGIDLESVERATDLLECENSFCHPAEMRTLDMDKEIRAQKLLQIWTAKEAILKALGTGLSHPPELIRIIFGPWNTVAESAQNLPEIGDQIIRRLENSIFKGFCVMLSSKKAAYRSEIVLNGAFEVEQLKSCWAAK